jgi:tetratricopeptide (TPR) repeat protein
MFGRALMKYTTRFAAWVTPHVKEWHRRRHEDRLEGERHLGAGNYGEAEKHLTTAVTLAVRRRDAPHKRAALRLQLAEAQRELEKFDEAEATARAAIEDAGQDREWRALALDGLAEIQIARGDFRDAHRSIVEAVCLSADAASSARRMHRLARAQYQGEDPIRGMESYALAMQLHEQAFGAEHVETGHLLAELGEIHRTHGNHTDAQTQLRRALKIHEVACGADSTEATQDLANLAASLEESGDREGAMAQFERALRLKERQVGGNMDDLAEMQARVARMYAEWGERGKARSLLAQAIPALRRKAGAPLAGALETMAQLEEASGNPREAARIRETVLTLTSGQQA